MTEFHRITRPGKASTEYIDQGGNWTAKSADAKNYYEPKEEVKKIAKEHGASGVATYKPR
jgi:hypothetical protein